MARLAKLELREKLIEALQEAEAKFLIIESGHPFLFRVYTSAAADADVLDIRVYIWNCTHGGGAKRASDEFRIQITGTAPAVHSLSEATLVLGWYDDLGVFAGFDIAHHDNQSASSSPSMQIKLAVLEDAAESGFSAATRGNDEIVVAFRPEFLVEYARQRDHLHKSKAGVTAFAKRLANVTSLPDDEIEDESDSERKEVLVQLRKKHRAADFRKRILVAYGNKCAMCGTQLRLVEAAHILPVKVPGSNDTTRNGVALCVLHHRAFDAVLVSFDENYRIGVSRRRIHDLAAAALADGSKEFAKGLGKTLFLPANPAHHPKPDYITKGRKVRGWLN